MESNDNNVGCSITFSVLCYIQAHPVNISRSGRMHAKVSQIRQPCGWFSVERLPGKPFGLKNGYPVIFNIPTNTELKTVTTIIATRLTLWIYDQVQICLYLTRLENAKAVGFISIPRRTMLARRPVVAILATNVERSAAIAPSIVTKRHDPLQTKRQSNILTKLTKTGTGVGLAQAAVRSYHLNMSCPANVSFLSLLRSVTV